MSTTRTDLVEAILDNPDDDHLRLVFSDYLEENGEADYARFIRTQIELAGVPQHDPLWIRCWFHDRDAISGRHMEKERPLLHGARWDPFAFRRGFPASIEVDDVEMFVAQAPTFFRLAPIESLRIHSDFGAPPPNIAALCDSPYLSRIRELRFSLSRISAAEIECLQDSPHAANLTDLQFEFAGIDSSGVAALFRPPLIKRLKSLHLHGNDISAAHLAAAIRETDPPFSLRHLTINERGSFWPASDFFNAPLLRNLAELNLSEFRLGADGFHALCTGSATALEALMLAKTDPGVPGIRALAECASLSGLRRLDLGNNRLGPVALKLLAQSPAFTNLRVLQLRKNPLGDKGAITLTQSQLSPQLLQLELTDCGIKDAGAAALLDSLRTCCGSTCTTSSERILVRTSRRNYGRDFRGEWWCERRLGTVLCRS